LATDPDLILTDEPTGNLGSGRLSIKVAHDRNLDAASANEVLALLSILNKQFGKTILMVTHDPHAASFAGRTLHLEKGELLASSNHHVE
jgi:putative ABC transport system ATP-binding protein